MGKTKRLPKIEKLPEEAKKAFEQYLTKVKQR
jgi:hypothetical protein